jgi:CHAD domain-containing protein
MNRLAKELIGAARSPDDPDAVHDLRVAIRRFIESIKIFPEVFGDSASKKFRRKLKPLLRALGDVRNLDVTTGVLNAARAKPTQAIVDRLQSDKRNAQKALSELLRSWRKSETVEAWLERINGETGDAKAFADARDRGPEMIEKLVKNGNRALEPGVPYRKMHRFRLATKRLRYALELFWPDNRNELKLLKQLQDHLGSVNDCVMVLDLLDDAPTITERVRALRSRREKALRTFWKENHGTLSTASRRS